MLWTYSHKRQKCKKGCGYIPSNLKIARKFSVSRRAKWNQEYDIINNPEEFRLYVDGELVENQ